MASAEHGGSIGSAGPATIDPGASGGFFTRQSSGLVRDISFSSSIGLNITFMSIPFAVLLATQAPLGFPGSSLFLIIIISSGLCVAPAILWSMFMGIMPRSGGDYIYVSRTLGPWIGLAGSVNIFMWFLLVIGNLAYTVPSVGISPAFTAIGVATHNHWWITAASDVSSKGWSIAIGIGVLVLSALMVSIPLRRMLRIFMTLFYFSLVGIFIALILLLLHGRSDFVHDVHRFGGNYAQIIASAHKAGFTNGHGLDIGQSILATPLGFAAVGFSFVLAYAGGEVSGATSRGRYSILICVMIAAVVLGLLMVLASSTFGTDFLGSATFLSNSASKAYPFGSPSFFFFYVSMLTGSTFVIVILNLSFIAAVIVLLPASFLILTRILFAWSFDRVIPDRVNEISSRWRAPLLANGIVLVGTIAYLFLVAYGGSTFSSLLYAGVMAETLTLILVAITGLVFPFLQKRLYETAPLARKYYGRVPSMTVIAALSLGAYGLFFYSLAATDALGANGDTGIDAMVVIAVVSLLAYPISRAVNRRRGVDLALAFKEIPPD